MLDSAALLRAADNPGIALNAAEEQRLEAIWRELQLGCGCRRRKTKPVTIRKTSRGCGGCGR